MRYASVRSMDVSNGSGIGVSLFVQGCPNRCSHCFNPETWDFNGGKEWTKETENKLLELLNKPYIARFTVLGGEPLAIENVPDVYKLLCKIKELYPQKKIWLYTGFTLTPELFTGLYQTLKLCDYVVDGEYVHELRDPSLLFRGSSNQRIIDIKKTIEKQELTLYEGN